MNASWWCSGSDILARGGRSEWCLLLQLTSSHWASRLTRFQLLLSIYLASFNLEAVSSRASLITILLWLYCDGVCGGGCIIHHFDLSSSNPDPGTPPIAVSYLSLSVF